MSMGKYKRLVVKSLYKTPLEFKNNGPADTEIDLHVRDDEVEIYFGRGSGALAALQEWAGQDEGFKSSETERELDTLRLALSSRLDVLEETRKRLRQAEVERDTYKKDAQQYAAYSYSPFRHVSILQLQEENQKLRDRLAQVKMAVRDV